MLILNRIFQNDSYTIGKLYDGDTYLCDTLEPPVNVNHPCVPVGTYEINYQPSKKFGTTMPFLLNVSGRVGIMLHPGNKPRDTQGCILVGRNNIKGTVLNSKVTFANLDKLIRGYIGLCGMCTITIKNK